MDILFHPIWENIARSLWAGVVGLSAQQVIHLLLFALFLVFVSLRISKPKVMSVAGVVVSYFIWRVNSTILPFVHEGPFVQFIMWGYLVAEIISILDIVQNELFELIKTRRKQRLTWVSMVDDTESSDRCKQKRKRQSGPKVDIIIPTYNEDETLLRKTILRSLSVAYDNKTVNSPEFSRHPRFSFSAAVRTRRVTASRSSHAYV